MRGMLSWAWTVIAALAAPAAVGACFSPDERDGAVACSVDGSCPEEFVCAWDGLCYREPPDRPDASTPPTVDAAADAAVDAGAPDALVCAAGADDCDGTPANGCEVRDTDPLCQPGAILLGNVSGDVGADTRSTGGYEETWLLVPVKETDAASSIPITARFDLESPPDVNFDLYVVCSACGDGRALSSTNGAGLTDSISIGRADGAGDRSFDVLVEVRWASSDACGDWSLTVTGHQATADRTCN